MKSYTYIIGWTEHQKYYYGVRWANKVLPEEDLWIEYFTSSEYVKKFRELNGEPDIIKIDCVFDAVSDAVEYEKKKLSEYFNLNWDNWLNKSTGVSIIIDDQLREILREHTRKQFLDPDKRKRHKESCISHKDKIWINNGEKNKRVTLEQYETPLYSEWERGRLIPKDSKFGHYDKSGSNNPFYGKSHTINTKDKISQTKKQRRKHYGN